MRKENQTSREHKGRLVRDNSFVPQSDRSRTGRRSVVQVTRVYQGTGVTSRLIHPCKVREKEESEEVSSVLRRNLGQQSSLGHLCWLPRKRPHVTSSPGSHLGISSQTLSKICASAPCGILRAQLRGQQCDRQVVSMMN